MRKREIYAKILANIILLILIILFFKYLFGYIFSLIFPFIISYALVLLAKPFIKILNKIKIKRKPAAIIFISTIICSITAITYITVKKIYDTIILITDEIYNSSEEINSTIYTISVYFNKYLGKDSSELNTIDTQISEAINKIVSLLTTYLTDYAGKTISNIPFAIFVFLIITLCTYSMIAENFNINFEKIFKNSKIIRIKTEIIDVTEAYFIGQLKIMFVVFIILAIGLGVLKIKYFILIAFIVAFIDLLPIFGTGAVFWPWMLIEFIKGNTISAIMLFVIYIVAFLARQIMQPKMTSQTLELKPIPTFMLMFIGYKIWGVIGLITTPFAGMIFYKLFQIGIFDNYKKIYIILKHDILQLLKITDDDVNKYINKENDIKK